LNSKRRSLIPDCLIRLALGGLVAENLDESHDVRRSITNWGKLTDRPKTRSVFSDPPALLTSPTDLNGILDLPSELPTISVFFSEYPLQSLADHLRFGPPEDTMSAYIPTRNHASRIGADDCGIGRAIDHLAPLVREDVVRVQHISFSEGGSEPELF
jgi:hypothetical protein